MKDVSRKNRKKKRREIEPLMTLKNKYLKNIENVTLNIKFLTM